MRFSTSRVAMSVATTVALAIVGCSQQKSPENATPTGTPVAATQAPATSAPVRAAEATEQPLPPKSYVLRTVDHSVTPEKLSGNPAKYNNRTVQFSCKIQNVIAGSDHGYHEANAMCSSGNTSDFTSSGYHFPVTIVLAGRSVGDMDAGETVKVLGIATHMTGKNVMGVETDFPMVFVEYAE